MSASISYTYDSGKHRFYIFSVTDVDSSQYILNSMLKSYLVSIYVTVLDTNLNTIIPRKKILRFAGNDRYAMNGPSLSKVLSSNRILLSYTVRDTLIDQPIDELAEKFLLIDDSCMMLRNEFWAWEPTGKGADFSTHFTNGDIYKLHTGDYAIRTAFGGSIGKSSGQLFLLDSNLYLKDTFDLQSNSDLFNNPIEQDEKRILGFRNYHETYVFLQTGSMIASSIGAYTGLPIVQGKPAYNAFGLAKGGRSTGYRPTQYYFPPHADTADYEHGAKLNFFPTVYNTFDNRLYLFSATETENQFNYCINNRPNLGQITAVDTSLREKWVKYIYAQPGYCIRSYCSAVPDHGNGVLISGIEYPYSDPENESLWRYFIYRVDSTTRLGIDDEQGHLTITDQFVVYPNPAEKELHIRNTLGDAFEYSISTAIGQKIAFGVGKGIETKADIGQLPAGMYIISIAAKSGRFFK